MNNYKIKNNKKYKLYKVKLYKSNAYRYNKKIKL